MERLIAVVSVDDCPVLKIAVTLLLCEGNNRDSLLLHHLNKCLVGDFLCVLFSREHFIELEHDNASNKCGENF